MRNQSYSNLIYYCIVIWADEDDIATYTINIVDDPRTLNKTLYLRPAANILSHKQVVQIWEKQWKRLFIMNLRHMISSSRATTNLNTTFLKIEKCTINKFVFECSNLVLWNIYGRLSSLYLIMVSVPASVKYR